MTLVMDGQAIFIEACSEALRAIAAARRAGGTVGETQKLTCPRATGAGQSLFPNGGSDDEKLVNQWEASPPRREMVGKLPRLVHPHRHAVHRQSRRHAVEELLRDRRQQGPGDDVIDVAGAALDFLAAAS